MPVTSDPAYVARLEEALAALGDAEGPLRARLLARLAEHLALAGAGDRPAELGAEAVAMARRVGDDGALAAALMGHHAALLDIEHAPERLATIDEAVAVAERIGAGEVAALALHWRIFDLVELGDLAARQGLATPASRRSRSSSTSRSTRTPRSPGAASGRTSRGGWTRPSGSTASRCGSPRPPDRPTRAASSSPSCSPSAATRAASASCSTRSSGSRASAARSASSGGRRCRSCCCRPGSASAPARPTRPRSPPRSTGLPGSLFRLSGLTCVAEACAARRGRAGRRRADRRAGAPRRPPRADRVQRLLGLGPALPRPAPRDRRPPGGGARAAAGRSGYPPRARRPAAGRGHPARSRRCIRRAPRRSIGRPATLPPLAGPTEARKPAAGTGPRDGVRGPGRAVSVRP